MVGAGVGLRIGGTVGVGGSSVGEATVEPPGASLGAVTAGGMGVKVGEGAAAGLGLGLGAVGGTGLVLTGGGARVGAATVVGGTTGVTVAVGVGAAVGVKVGHAVRVGVSRAANGAVDSRKLQPSVTKTRIVTAIKACARCIWKVTWPDFGGSLVPDWPGASPDGSIAYFLSSWRKCIGLGSYLNLITLFRAGQ